MHEPAVQIARERGYINEDKLGLRDKGGYSTFVGKALALDVEPYRATHARWCESLIERTASSTMGSDAFFDVDRSTTLGCQRLVSDATWVDAHFHSGLRLSEPMWYAIW